MANHCPSAETHLNWRTWSCWVQNRLWGISPISYSMSKIISCMGLVMSLGLLRGDLMREGLWLGLGTSIPTLWLHLLRRVRWSMRFRISRSSMSRSISRAIAAESVRKLCGMFLKESRIFYTQARSRQQHSNRSSSVVNSYQIYSFYFSLLTRSCCPSNTVAESHCAGISAIRQLTSNWHISYRTPSRYRSMSTVVTSCETNPLLSTWSYM